MNRWTAIRVAIARAICPPGTVVVPPCVSRPPVRADIAPTPTRASPDTLKDDIRAQVIQKAGSSGPIRLFIVQCPDSSMWYADKVGKYVPFEGKWPEGWISREDAGYINIVKFQDARVV